ncbi:MAG: fasciclin domain-containing protein, partial [Bacteroidales bacterium]|nr:fasciclin domain-containing protein [Bacteroidales bacterium]
MKTNFGLFSKTKILTFVMLGFLVSTFNSFSAGSSKLESNTVVDIIVGSSDHTTLAAAVTAAGLVETLQSAGPFTVFAPTNAAFDMLPAGTVDALLADPTGDLTDILLYHVLGAKVMSGDLSDGQMASTVNGKD